MRKFLFRLLWFVWIAHWAFGEVEMSPVGSIDNHGKKIVVAAADQDRRPLVVLIISESEEDMAYHVFGSDEELDTFLLAMYKAVESTKSLSQGQKETYWSSGQMSRPGYIQLEGSKFSSLLPSSCIISITKPNGIGIVLTDLNSIDLGQLSKLLRNAQTLSKTQTKRDHPQAVGTPRKISAPLPTAKQFSNSDIFVRNHRVPKTKLSGQEVYLQASQLAQMLSAEELQRITAADDKVFVGEEVIGDIQVVDGEDWLPLIAVMRHLGFRIAYSELNRIIDCYPPTAGQLPNISQYHPEYYGGESTTTSSGYTGGGSYTSSGYTSRRAPGTDVHVRSYYRKDGTYVRSHTRSSPGRRR